MRFSAFSAMIVGRKEVSDLIWDCHMHMVLDGVEWRSAIGRHQPQPKEDWIREILAQYQRQGYRYLRDGGDRWGVGRKARDLAPEYGIEYRTPLAPLCKAGHYGAFIGEKYDNLRGYAELVRKMRAQGADFIKIMISGLMDFDTCGRLTEEGLPADLIRELIHIAHEEGFSVMAHANGARTIEAAALAGIDSVEHGAYSDEDSLRAMVENKVSWVPTVSTVGNLRGKGRFNEEAVQGILAHTLNNVETYVNLGGILAPGSDAGAWAVPHGCRTEYELLRSVLGDRTEAVLTAGAEEIVRRF